MAFDFDVGVVGGGPAGLAAAISIHRKGLSAAVFDPDHLPIDKACGEGVMPDGVAALRILGLELPDSTGMPFHGLRFVERGQQIEASFPSGHGIGIRRTVLHTALAEHALKTGVRLHWGTPVRSMAGGTLAVGDRAVRCRWVVGADGHNSRVRGWAGLGGRTSAQRRYAFRRHYARQPWTATTEVHWADCGQAYVTPVGRDCVSIALIVRDRGLRFEDLPRWFPELQRRLGDAQPVSALRGAVTVSRSLRRVVRGKVALAGDASGSIDAITGQGLSLAFRQAVALGEALRKEDLSFYEREHARIRRLPERMARLLLLLDRQPGLRRRVLAAFRSDRKSVV